MIRYVTVTNKVSGAISFASMLGFNVFPAAIGALIMSDPDGVFPSLMLAFVVALAVLFAAAAWVGRSLREYEIAKNTPTRFHEQAVELAAFEDDDDDED